MVKKLKIAILAPEFIPTWGGVGIYTVELVRELSKRKDIEVHVLLPIRTVPLSTIEKEFKKVKFHSLGHVTGTFTYARKVQQAVKKKLPELHSKYNFDIVHSMNLVHMPDLFIKLNVPHICTVHTTLQGQVAGFLQSNKNFFKMAPSEKGQIILYPYISYMQKKYIHKNDALITVSGTFVDIIENQFKYGKQIIPIRNGINSDSVGDTKVNLKDAEKKFPKFKNKLLITFAGRLVMQKGIQDLVWLMKNLPSGFDAHFAIAGSGNEKVFHSWIEEYGVDKSKFTFLGFVPNKELPKLLKLTDIFVLPSYYENFPISLLEAMSMKCACIGTNVGAVHEIIENNKTGVLIEAGDREALLKGVSKLCNDKKYRARLAKGGYDKVMKNFTSKIMAEKTIKVYREVLKGK